MSPKMRPDPNKPRLARIDRLSEFYDPFDALCIEQSLKKVLRHKPQARILEKVEDRTERYHYGRIRYFMENPDPTPIDIDAGIPGYSSYVLTVLDGHHRFCAAILAGQKTIRFHGGGWVDFMDYLTGKRKKNPWQA